MSEPLDRESQTEAEESFTNAALISQPVSDDEDSSDDEGDNTRNIEGKVPSALCMRNLSEQLAAVASTSEGEPKDTQTEENTAENTAVASTSEGEPKDIQTEENTAEKCYDALNYHSREGHSSSSEAKSTESSTERSFVIEYRATDDFVDVTFLEAIDRKDLSSLMQKCRVDHYSAGSSKVDVIYMKCKMLFDRDYVCEVIDNSGGSLCKHYPERIIIPVAEKSDAASSESSKAVEFDKELYTDLVKASISCRLRKRFVAPVILFRKKFICRAGTITVRKTAVYETSNTTSPPRSQNINESPIKRKARNFAQNLIDMTSRGVQAASQLFVPSSIRKLRNVDAQILGILKVQYICDLMIEGRKKFKHIRLSSSEKINPDIYRDCSIEQMPYPGCTFFRRYHESKHVPDGLVFNWNRPDAEMDMKYTEDPYLTFPDIKWDDYKKWDVVVLTKNYLKVLLSYLAKGEGGLLVHCISGWDRTPLFISILRASLWADGIIHESLNYQEMAFLTLAYDWYLFGHDLPSRLGKKQEIMHFCFKFLPYIATDEFSLTRMLNNLPPELKDSALPDFKPGRRAILNEFSSYVLNIYEEFVTGMLG